MLLTALKGEFNINGLRNKDIQKTLGLNGAKSSRLLKRLWAHGIIKKIGNSYKYYVTKLGKETVITAQKIKELVLIPALCY